MRLIDADELKCDFRQTFVDGESIDIRGVMERIELLTPTIDAVLVVRCAECQYSHVTGLRDPRLLDCEKNGLVLPHGYCNYGQRSGI